MSLYYTQKLLYDINRDPRVQDQYKQDPINLLANYKLSDEEKTALMQPDIGLLYVLGVNGQILMHFTAFHQISWDDYLQSMRDGVERYGPVRDGIYAMTGDGQSFTKDTEVPGDG